MALLVTDDEPETGGVVEVTTSATAGAITSESIDVTAGEVVEVTFVDEHDLVIGSRHHAFVRAGRLREITGRMRNPVAWLALVGGYQDTQTGIEAFWSDAAHLLAEQARIDWFAIDMEVPHLADRNTWCRPRCPWRSPTRPSARWGSAVRRLGTSPGSAGGRPPARRISRPCTATPHQREGPT